MKSGSGSAIGFGRVLQTVRKHSLKNQADVAAFFSPKLSVAAVSMAESGNRPPKTEAMVRTYADALELDADDLLELWWAMQGMVELEDPAHERDHQQWWRELWVNPQADLDHHQAESKANAIWTPNDDYYAPSRQLFALANAICDILKRLLGDTWTVDYKSETGLRDPVEGRVARVLIELQAGNLEEGTSMKIPGLTATFACPEPLTRPNRSNAAIRPKDGTMQPEVAWILSSVEAMPARERTAVAGFIRGLREGASLFSETELPSHPDR